MFLADCSAKLSARSQSYTLRAPFSQCQQACSCGSAWVPDVSLMGERDVSVILKDNPPFRLLTSALHYQWRAATLPLSLTQYWLSTVATFVTTAFVWLGAPPSQLKSDQKLHQAMHTVDHLSQREEIFRKRIKELEDESEGRLKDKRKALTKLHKARAQLNDASNSEGLHPAVSDSLNLSPLPEDPTTWKVQLSFFGAAVIPVLWFWSQAETPALSRKVVSCVLFPEILMYVWKYFSRPTRAYDTALHCGCWFLAGFIFCHWLLAHSSA